MKKHKLKKILWISLSTFLFLSVVLVIHIYMVTRPKAPTESTTVLARVDFKQAINKSDADKITNWLYEQKGVDHVMCNDKAGIAVFSFHPVKTSGDKIVNDMRTALNYNAVRYMPTKEEMAKGCPAMSGSSFTSTIYKSVSNLFN